MKRFIFRSSGAVQRAAEKYEPIKSMVEARLDDIPDPRPVVSHLDPPWPDAMYGVDKTAGEAVCRDSWIGDCGQNRARQGQKPAANAREASVYFSHRDVE